MVPLPAVLGPGLRLGARWNRLGEAMKTRQKREKTGEKWARHGLKRVNKGRDRGITCSIEPDVERKKREGRLRCSCPHDHC
eukprot:COSAG04_NODE_13979_length_584_cov_12.529897_1_plen_80_part_10